MGNEARTQLPARRCLGARGAEPALPGRELAEAAAGGEWDEAAGEILAALGLALRRSPRRRAIPQALPPPARPTPRVLLVPTRAPARPVTRGHAPARRAPEPACSPYEGVWAAESDGVQPLLFVNPCSMEVERFMRSCGLGRPRGHQRAPRPRRDRVRAPRAPGPARGRRPRLPRAPRTAPASPGGSPAAAYGGLPLRGTAPMPASAERLAAEALSLHRAAAASTGAPPAGRCQTGRFQPSFHPFNQ